MDALYEFLRGAAGFGLLLSGLTLLLLPGRTRVFVSFGTLFLCAGGLFTQSALDPVVPLPLDVGNALTFGLVFLLSRSLFEISLYIFGDERWPGFRRQVSLVGGLWTLALWGIPFLDLVAPGSWARTIEDGRMTGDFHRFSEWAVYLWPIVVLVVSTLGGRRALADIPLRSRTGRELTIGLLAILVVLVTVVAAILMRSEGLYRVAHSLLEGFLFVWYFYVIRFPDSFRRYREEVEEGHQRRNSLEDSEAEIIAGRLDRLVSEQKIFCDPRLDLEFLAARVQIPSYRLSMYFNSQLNLRFSVWLNGLRVEYAKEQLLLRPDDKVLDIAFESGYSTKSIFYSQFRNAVGLTPAQFRQRPQPAPQGPLTGSGRVGESPAEPRRG